MQSKNKKVLVVSAKWPEVSSSTDGGDSTLAEIIKAISSKYIVDILCFREDIDENIKLNNVRKIIVHKDDFAVFKNYALHNQEKFLVRIRQAEIAVAEIDKLADEYNLIIVQHVMFILKMQNKRKLLQKIALYPMFTGTSYLISGEDVPSEYIAAERRVLKYVKRIFTPSIVEKATLCNDYGVETENICLVPRPVLFKYKKKDLLKSERINIVYIASIRMQKNHIEALKLVKILKNCKADIVLNCIGAIQDSSIYEECWRYIEMNGLSENVIFHGNRSRNEITQILENCDINISVSNWETFGRGIYEGMTFGLPTIILNGLKCVTGAKNIGIYPMVVNDISEMSDRIIELVNNTDLYNQESQKGQELEKVLNEDVIYCKMIHYYEEMMS